MYGLMNEPYSVNKVTLIRTLNSVIAAIRAAGHDNTILLTTGGVGDVCNYGTGCGTTYNFDQIVDPKNRVAGDLHVYYDTYGSGQSDVGGAQALG